MARHHGLGQAAAALRDMQVWQRQSRRLGLAGHPGAEAGAVHRTASQRAQQAEGLAGELRQAALRKAPAAPAEGDSAGDLRLRLQCPRCLAMGE